MLQQKVKHNKTVKGRKNLDLLKFMLLLGDCLLLSNIIEKLMGLISLYHLEDSPSQRNISHLRERLVLSCLWI